MQVDHLLKVKPLLKKISLNKMRKGQQQCIRDMKSFMKWMQYIHYNKIYNKKMMTLKNKD